MLGNKTSERQKAIINLISRIKLNFAELGDYKSHIEDSIGAHIVLTNGKIFVPHIAIEDAEFAFQKPNLLNYIRNSFVPFNSHFYNSTQQPLWKKLINIIKPNEYVFE